MTLIKICGITNEHDLIAAIEAGADLVGFILYDKSPRAVTREKVAEFMKMLRGLDVPRIPLCVGVFVNPSVDDVVETVRECRLQAAQIHKVSGKAALGAMRQWTGGAAYAAIQPRSYEEAISALDFIGDRDEANPDTIGIAPWLPQLLIDAYHPELSGGTGQRADLEIVRQVMTHIPRTMVAGGLTPDNVGEVVRAVTPWAVDVSSGVEASPGLKDHAKVRDFIQAVRAIYAE
jgi:phosphoribosylanthranilate isomerase